MASEMNKLAEPLESPLELFKISKYLDASSLTSRARRGNLP